MATEEQSELERLRDDLRRAEEALAYREADVDRIRGRIEALEERCFHEWEVEYVPEIVPGPRPVPGHWPLGYTPGKLIKKWTRTCKICNRVEVTTDIAQRTSEEPMW